MHNVFARLDDSLDQRSLSYAAVASNQDLEPTHALSLFGKRSSAGHLDARHNELGSTTAVQHGRSEMLIFVLSVILVGVNTWRNTGHVKVVGEANGIAPRRCVAYGGRRTGTKHKGAKGRLGYIVGRGSRGWPGINSILHNVVQGVEYLVWGVILVLVVGLCSRAPAPACAGLLFWLWRAVVIVSIIGKTPGSSVVAFGALGDTLSFPLVLAPESVTAGERGGLISRQRTN